MFHGLRLLYLAALVAMTLTTTACGGRGEAPTPPLQVNLEAEAEAAAEVITPERLRDSVAILAADEMEGRGPGSPGDERARAWIEEELRALGLQPGGPRDQWQQPFDMVGITAHPPASWSFTRDGRKASFRFWDEYIAAAGAQSPTSELAETEVVFVGYGIQAPEHDWDDFKGTDLRGKTLLMLNNDPDFDPELFAGERRLYYGRWTYKYESAAAQGAAGAIIIHTPPSAGYGWQVVQSSWTGEQFELPAADEPRLQVAAWLTEAAARRLVALAGHDLDELVEAARQREFAPVPLAVTTSLSFANDLRRVQTANVLGLLSGRDPALADEVVLFTAHHDHLGIGSPVDGDAIYNGAQDNATGVAVVLGIARAFQALPAAPRRSVLFALVGAEEQGLLGSQYYAAHPTFAAGKIAAVVNFDSSTIFGPTRDVTFVGLEKSDLGPLVEELAATQERVVKPDQFPSKGIYYRSDQFSLAKIGVPGVYLKVGTDPVDGPAGALRETIEAYEAAHYHQPSDELREEWSFAGMVLDARLGFLTGLRVAERDEMPRWAPGDEFEAARETALAAPPAADTP